MSYDPAAVARQIDRAYLKPWPIDRIDSKSNIRGHLTLDNQRTLCGLRLGQTQPHMNAMCRRCEKIAADRVAAANAAGEE